MTYPKEKIKEIYRSVPEEISLVLFSEDLLPSIEEIVQENGLNAEQKNQLGDEITLKLLGVTTDSTLVGNIQERLGLSAEAGEKVASSVRSTILSKVKPEILSAQESVAQAKLQQNSNEETLKSIPEQKPETQEIAPKVVVEAPKPEQAQAKPSINLIPPPTPAPKPLDLAPPNLPVTEKKPMGMIENKLSQASVVSAPRSAYPDGKDPYREPTN